jgi:hypothetical protein
MIAVRQNPLCEAVLADPRRGHQKSLRDDLRQPSHRTCDVRQDGLDRRFDLRFDEFFLANHVEVGRDLETEEVGESLAADTGLSGTVDDDRVAGHQPRRVAQESRGRVHLMTGTVRT